MNAKPIFYDGMDWNPKPCTLNGFTGIYYGNIPSGLYFVHKNIDGINVFSEVDKASGEITIVGEFGFSETSCNPPCIIHPIGVNIFNGNGFELEFFRYVDKLH